MSKIIYLAFVFLIFSQVLSQSFLSKSSNSFNFLKCIEDASSLKTEITNFINELKTKGFSIEQIITEITVLEPKIVQALSDCGITTIDFDSIIAKLHNEKREVSFNPTSCFQDISLLIQSGSKLIADIEAKNILSIISDLTNFVAVGKTVLSDCLSVNATTKKRVLASNEISFLAQGAFGGIFDCISDIKDVLLPDLQAFIAAVKAGDISQIVSKINVIINDFNKTLADCQFGEEIRKKFETPAECIGDITDLVNLVNVILTNIKNNDYSALISNVLALVDEIKKTTSDCSGSKSTSIPEINALVLPNVGTDVFKCMTDIQYMVDEVTQLYDEIKSGNFSITDLISRVQNIISDFKTLEEDCGLANFTSPAKLNPAACISEAIAAVGSLEKIFEAYQAKDYETLISEVISFVESLKQLSADCLNYNITQALMKHHLFVNIDPITCFNDIISIKDRVTEILSLNSTDYDGYARTIVDLVFAVENSASSCLNVNLTSIFGIDPEICAISLESIFQGVEALISDVKSESFSNIINDIVYLEAALQNSSQNCLALNIPKLIKFNPEQCLADVESLVLNVESLISQVSAGNYSNILPLVLAVISNVETVSQDCFSQNLTLILIRGFKFNPEECLSDIVGLVNLIEQAINDYKTGNYSNLVTDVLALVQNVEQSLSDCASITPNTSVVIKNTESCINDLLSLIPLVEQTYNDYTNGNYGALISDLENLVQKAESSYSDCFGKNITININLKNLKFNPSQCLADIENIIPLVENVVNDIKNKDYGKLITDGLVVVQTAQQLVTDCTSSSREVIESYVPKRAVTFRH